MAFQELSFLYDGAAWTGRELVFLSDGGNCRDSVAFDRSGVAEALATGRTGTYLTIRKKTPEGRKTIGQIEYAW